MAADDTRLVVVADIAIIAYFFAMRSCEITTTPQRGRTKIVRLRGVTFRDDKGRELEIRNYDGLKSEATRVTITFEDQKNGLKMDKRTHQKTNDEIMCPVRRLIAIVRRLDESGFEVDPDTTLNLAIKDGVRTTITGEYLRDSLRATCREGGGKREFGYDPDEIGTRSIRSGAAMGLFLMDHSVAKIMILGRWSSDAFLVYIRPQVMEWTNQMSSDMIQNESFFDAGNRRARGSKGEPNANPTRMGRKRARVPGGNKTTEGMEQFGKGGTTTQMFIDH
jgi:hypothetical protein